MTLTALQGQEVQREKEEKGAPEKGIPSENNPGFLFVLPPPAGSTHQQGQQKKNSRK